MRIDVERRKRTICYTRGDGDVILATRCHFAMEVRYVLQRDAANLRIYILANCCSLLN